MTIRYLPWLDRERWYVITADRASEEGRPSWQHHGVWLHGPNTMAGMDRRIGSVGGPHHPRVVALVRHLHGR